MKYKLLFQYTLPLLFFAVAAQGQNDKALLRELAEENKKSVEALALYPSETRLAILQAAAYPEVLIKMDNTRQKTAAAFRTLIEDFPQATQLIFYDIARYPGLLQQLIDRAESPSALEESLRQLPEQQREGARDLVLNNIRTLLKVNELDQTSRNTFEDLMDGYPAPARAAFRQLVELPEVLEILNKDLRFTILVGDLYKADPAWVIHKTDSLNLAVARAHAEETEEWKQQIESDPQAEQELQTASREYAAEYGYTYPDDSDQAYEEDAFNASVVVVHHYPWWFGYPWWYPAQCWEPYPWWYQWGYHRYNKRFVVVYMPSGHFMDWYFHHPGHHEHYSHLSAHFVQHYYGHRHSGTTISMGVGDWRDRNRGVISEEWMKDQSRLPKRLAEYGRFEESRQNHNGRNPKNPVDPETFLANNPRKYPELEQSKTQAQTENKRERENTLTRPSTWAPGKEPVPSVRPTATERNPVLKPDSKRTEAPVSPKPQAKPIDKSRTEPGKARPAEKAQEYHRSQWEESNRQESKREQTPAPKQQQQRKETAPQPQRSTTPPPRNPAPASKSGSRKN